MYNYGLGANHSSSTAAKMSDLCRKCAVQEWLQRHQNSLAIAEQSGTGGDDAEEGQEDEEKATPDFARQYHTIGPMTALGSSSSSSVKVGRSATSERGSQLLPQQQQQQQQHEVRRHPRGHIFGIYRVDAQF